MGFKITLTFFLLFKLFFVYSDTSNNSTNPPAVDYFFETNDCMNVMTPSVKQCTKMSSNGNLCCYATSQSVGTSGIGFETCLIFEDNVPRTSRGFSQIVDGVRLYINCSGQFIASVLIFIVFSLIVLI
jgi:hypothetical protein